MPKIIQYSLLVLLVFITCAVNANNCTDNKKAQNDKACQSSQSANAAKSKGEDSKVYSKAIEQRLNAEMKRLQISKANISKEEKANLLFEVHGNALKVYSRFKILDFISGLCDEHLKPHNVDIKGALTDYRKALKDDILIGERVFKTGYVSPDKKINLSNEDLKQKVEIMKNIQRKNFTLNEAKNNKSFVLSECEKQYKFMKAGSQLQF